MHALCVVHWKSDPLYSGLLGNVVWPSGRSLNLQLSKHAIRFLPFTSVDVPSCIFSTYSTHFTNAKFLFLLVYKLYDICEWMYFVTFMNVLKTLIWLIGDLSAFMLSLTVFITGISGIDYRKIFLYNYWCAVMIWHHFLFMVVNW